MKKAEGTAEDEDGLKKKREGRKAGGLAGNLHVIVLYIIAAPYYCHILYHMYNTFTEKLLIIVD